MLLINKLTAPGGIQRVEIRPETVRIMTRDLKVAINATDKTKIQSWSNCSNEVTKIRIISRRWEDGWYYQWNRNNFASEGMIRELTPQEKGED